MSYLSLTKTFQLCFHFYKKIWLLSIGITIFLLFLNSEIPLYALGLFKILFFGVIFIYFLDPGLKKQLIFYKNFGLSKMALILISFLMDLSITVLLILIIGLF